ncbi:caspase domain-containing protein, partial [Methylobacterium sp. J-070]|uniref:caspase family protein n=1 Tax=Methylobacterium sp. J-070 TaxID=2836650 RepID=UPI001FBB344D
MRRSAVAFLVSVLLTLFAEAAHAEGRRVALVVGVGGYENVPKLPNAVGDANAMADLFRRAGFDVVAARNDTSNLEFKRAIREFEDAVTDSEIAVVYYAGHGIEIRDANYLIPTDAKLVNERDADDEAIPLDRILNALEGAKRLRLVILDACRDNPFASKIKRRVATRAISAGLGKVEPQQTDTLIAYAAKAQAVANDGEGTHSPFTTALLANLTVPGLDVRLAFGRVRDDVLKATNRQQEPFVYGSLGGGTVALVPARTEVATVAPNATLMANTRDEAVLAKSDYEIVERVGSKAAWEIYLNTHKSGLYADLARMQLAKLAAPPAAPGMAGVSRVALRSEPDLDGEVRPQVSPPVDAPPAVPMPRPTAAEARAWSRLKTSTDAAAIAKFIETYKTSPLIPEAQERLGTLERLANEKDERLRQEREAARQRDEDARQKRAAEDERKRLDREAARQRDEAEKAKAAETARLKAEALAAAKQQEAEARARAAEALARRREEEEAARMAEVARRKRDAEERAAALAAERVRMEAEIAARRREAEEANRAAAAARAAHEAEERLRLQASQDKQREAAEQARAAAAEAAARDAEARERAKAAESVARQREAEDRRRAAEISQAKAEAERSAQDKSATEDARVAETERRKAAAAAAAERRRAEEAAAAVAEQKAERAAAARRREAAEERRR